jgi:hypothetical protein
MKTEDIWPSVVNILPADLEQTAQQTGALERCRKVPNAAALMRLILADALSDLSVKDVAAWAAGLGIVAKTWDLAKAQAWMSARVVGTRTIKGTMIWVLTTLNP